MFVRLLYACFVRFYFLHLLCVLMKYIIRAKEQLWFHKLLFNVFRSVAVFFVVVVVVVVVVTCGIKGR